MAGCLDGQVAVIGGGTGGIGSVVAARLIAQGAAVIIAGRGREPDDRQRGAALAAALAAQGGQDAECRYIAADLTDHAACNAMIAAATRDMGRLDAVIDCTAGGGEGRVTGRFQDTEPFGYAGFLTASLLPLYNLAHAALPALAATGGAIIAFSSDAGRVAAANQSLIASTRAAIMMFVRSLALEVARDGVRVNCVSLSFVRETPQYDRIMDSPARRRVEGAIARAGLGLPAAGDIAPLVAFLCSAASRYMTGQIISINGGVSAG